MPSLLPVSRFPRTYPSTITAPAPLRKFCFQSLFPFSLFVKSPHWSRILTSFPIPPLVSFYSERSEFTGLARAALRTCMPTVNSVMSSTSPAGPTNSQGDASMRKA